MILYTIKDADGDIMAWAGNMADAGHKRKELGGDKWEQCEVPTNKTDLLEFLNTHAVVRYADPEDDPTEGTEDE